MTFVQNNYLDESSRVNVKNKRVLAFLKKMIFGSRVSSIYLSLEDENFYYVSHYIYLNSDFIIQGRLEPFKLIIRRHLYFFFTHLLFAGATCNSMSNFKIRKRRLRDFFFVAEFRLVYPWLRTTGTTKPLFPEIKDKGERLNGKNERITPCQSLIRINENSHLLDLRLFPL